LPLFSVQLKFAFRNWKRLEVCSWEGSMQVHKGWSPCFAQRDHSWGTPWERGASPSQLCTVTGCLRADRPKQSAEGRVGEQHLLPAHVSYNPTWELQWPL